MPTLKERTISGMLWSSVHRFGTMVISFGANLVLARLLTPEDFGIIGMLMVFIAVANTIVDGGFAAALIQKKNPTNEDYSTIFYWNLFLSVFLFGMLLLSAPSIASFYRMPELTAVLRVQGIVLILNAFSIIQLNQLTKQLNFKRLANVNIIATIIGAVVGITMAIMGFGVWSLVAKMLLISFSQNIILWFSSKWRPLKVFSWKSFRELFRFGSMLLCYSLLETVVFQLQALIIGRVFSAKELGFYTQAKRVHEIPERSFTQIITQVTFPVFSSIQDEHQRLVRALQTTMKTLAFLTFPVMILLIVIARPLFVILLTEKWSGSIVFFQILCCGGMMYSLNSNNVNVMKALGHSKYVLYSGVLKRAVTLIFIFVGFQIGLKEMIIGYVISMYFWFFINSFIAGRLTGYGFLKQIADLGPTYILSVLVGAAVYALSHDLVINDFLLVLVQVLCFVTLYILLCYFLRLEGFLNFLNIVKGQLKKKRNG